MARESIAKKLIAWVGVGIAIAGIIAWMRFHPVHLVCIKDLSNGKTVLETRTVPGDNLWIAFINSVENLPVADHFRVNDNYQIEFTETIFQAPYAGYDRSESAELIAPGTLKISGYARQMDAYTFFAGDIYRHMLFWNGNWLPLYEVARGGDIIEITIFQRSRLAFVSDQLAFAFNRIKRMRAHE